MNETAGYKIFCTEIFRQGNGLCEKPPLIQSPGAEHRLSVDSPLCRFQTCSLWPEAPSGGGNRNGFSGHS